MSQRFDEAYYAAALARLDISKINARRIAADKAEMSRGKMLTALSTRDVDDGVVDDDHAILKFLVDYDHSGAAGASFIPGRAYVEP